MESKQTVKLEQRCLFPNTNCTQAAEINLDRQSSKRGTRHAFPVNLAQIRSAVPEIFHIQTKNDTDSAKNRTSRSALRGLSNTHSSSLFTACNYAIRVCDRLTLYKTTRDRSRRTGKHYSYFPRCFIATPGWTGFPKQNLLGRSWRLRAYSRCAPYIRPCHNNI